MLEEALAEWFKGHEGKHLLVAAITQRRIPAARKRGQTHTMTRMTVYHNPYRKDIFGKLDSKTTRHAHLNLKGRFFQGKRNFPHFYCVDNVSTGNVTNSTLSENEGISKLFYFSRV